MVSGGDPLLDLSRQSTACSPISSARKPTCWRKMKQGSLRFFFLLLYRKEVYYV